MWIVCRDWGFKMDLEARVVEVFTKASTPLYAKEVAAQVGVSVQKITPILIRLRDKGVISNKIIDPTHNTRVWMLGVSPDPTPAPVSNLDKEHEEWLKKVLTKKPIYNPR